jgi:hypothetical protein
LAGDRPEVPIGTDSSEPYTATWTFPSCGAAPEDRFLIKARAFDNCGNVSTDSTVLVRLTGRGCFRSSALRGDAGSWLSELQVPAARGQVVVDGAEAVFPSTGSETFATPLGPGPHRFEATLVAGAARSGPGGSWRFDLQALRVAPGSLRVVAGDAIQVGADALVFRLRGRAGERVVFGFEVAGE